MTPTIAAAVAFAVLSPSLAFAAEVTGKIEALDVGQRIVVINKAAYYYPASIKVENTAIGKEATITFEVEGGKNVVNKVAVK